MTVEEYFKELIALPSPSHSEGEVALYLKNMFSSFGYKYREDDVGNVIFFKDTHGKKIAFACHMDTVDLAVHPTLAEDELSFYTNGTTALGADDKAGCAAILSVAEHYEGSNLVAIFTVAEEVGLYGSRYIDKKLLFEGLSIECIYVPDARGRVGTLTRSAVGKTRITMTFKGKTAHAGFAPESGINAIQMASAFVVNVKTGRLKERTTSNIGSLVANGPTNVVPATAVLKIEVRSDDDNERYALVSEYKKSALKYAKDAGGKVEFSEEDLYRAYTIDQNSSYVRRAIRAAESIKLNTAFVDTTGGSDANNFIRFGYQALVLATGYENAHSTDETIAKSELNRLVAFIEAILIA